MKLVVLTLFVSLTFAATPPQLPLVKEYSGANFFDRWDYWGAGDNLTWGNVWYVNQTEASSLGLTQINSAGNAVIKVDTSTVVWDNPRNTIRISTKDYFEIGTVFVLDVLHIPFGCSVWPSMWTKGEPWPENGEIDIIESVNLMGFNQMSLHTTNGCLSAPMTDQIGTSLSTNCSDTSAGGCNVRENKPNNWGTNFAQNNGGAWIMQFDVSGIYIWFFQRSNIPPSVSSANTSLTLDTESWGPPSAVFLNGTSCNISDHFKAQQIVIDIDLCGEWAGNAEVYNQTGCGVFTNNTCYLNNVLGNGQNYENAYFELSSIRAFSANPDAVFTPNATASPQATTPTAPMPTFSAAGSSDGSGAVTNSGLAIMPVALGLVIGVFSFFIGLMM